jgi:hypothetical protein
MTYNDYTDKDVSMQKWLDEIAPKYFDFDASELYMTSQFGYMNEVMSTVENDTHHSVSIARREFYPTTAHYLRSFYKMAALQQIGYPLAHAATATAILILRESDILTYGEYNENTHIRTFVLDNSAKFYAGSIPFMLDYPIKITCREYNMNSSLIALKYAYTARYDSSEKNDLYQSNQKYIKSRVYKHGAETLLLLKVTLRQCMLTKFSQAVNASPLITNVSMDFNVGKYMCNFEAFYAEAYATDRKQLVKIPVNANYIKNPFCAWQMLDDSTLRISFPNNPYFNPRYNSEVSLDVYTTLGEGGNFDRYDGPLSCQTTSERYPYNNSIRMTGKITGSSIGGVSMPSLDDFKQDVIAAYATNKTYTTDSDLQVMFDKVARTTRNRIIFSKRRDDCFERMYGAYMLLKDASGYVIPTNSLTCEFNENDLDHLTDAGVVVRGMGYTSHNDVIIRAGSVWRYHDESPIEQKIEPEYVRDSDLNYILTTDPVGNVPTTLRDDHDQLLYREVAYKYDEESNPIMQHYPMEDRVIEVTEPYSYFDDKQQMKQLTKAQYDDPETDQAIVVRCKPNFLSNNSLSVLLNINFIDEIVYDELPEATVGLLDQYYALSRLGQEIAEIYKCVENDGVYSWHLMTFDEMLTRFELCLGDLLFCIQDYGVETSSIYADNRNMVQDPATRKFMVYPDTSESITTIDVASYDDLYKSYLEVFTKWFTMLAQGTASEEGYSQEKIDEMVELFDTNEVATIDDIPRLAASSASIIKDAYAYTNPFLIRYHPFTGVSAYYKNTFKDTYPLDLVHVEDASIIQFNASGISVDRNAIFGENFYKLTISIQPSISDINLASFIYTPQDSVVEDKPDNGDDAKTIVAAFDGIVDKFVYISSTVERDGQHYAGCVYMLLKYYPGSDQRTSELPVYVNDADLNVYIEQNYPNAEAEGYYIAGVRISSTVYILDNTTGNKEFGVQECFNTNLIAGSKFRRGSEIATLRDIDNQQVRVIAMLKSGNSVKRELYIPFIFESYDPGTDNYNFSAYIKTEDEINDNDGIYISDGIYVSNSASADDGMTIPEPENIFFSIGIFVRYDDDNLPLTSDENDNYAARYRNMPYIYGYTLANVYENMATAPIKFMELYRFIRSISINRKSDILVVDPDTLVELSADNLYVEIREIPLVRAEWARNPGNIFDLFKLLKANHDWVTEAYDLLDNNFTINMKMYNTYGRSRYLNIGNNYENALDGDPEGMTALDSVTLNFKFGVKLRSLIDANDFKARFITYIRTYIENFNTVENYGLSIYMSDLYTKLNQKFKDEIIFLEYYGINNFDAQRSQVIESWNYEDINALGYNKYIPEFINLETTKVDNMFVPTVELTFID